MGIVKDQEVCEWIVAQRAKLNEFIDTAADEAKPGRSDVFKKLLAVNNALVEVFWEINIARERERHSIT